MSIQMVLGRIGRHNNRDTLHFTPPKRECNAEQSTDSLKNENQMTLSHFPSLLDKSNQDAKATQDETRLREVYQCTISLVLHSTSSTLLENF